MHTAKLVVFLLHLLTFFLFSFRRLHRIIEYPSLQQQTDFAFQLKHFASLYIRSSLHENVLFFCSRVRGALAVLLFTRDTPVYCNSRDTDLRACTFFSSLCNVFFGFTLYSRAAIVVLLTANVFFLTAINAFSGLAFFVCV